MGKRRSSPAPAPAAAPKPVAVPTQSLQSQVALNEVSGAQSRLNMTLGSQLDQRNKEFFTTQDIRQTQATGGETRATLATQGEQERATDLQKNMQQNYVMGRQHDWAQDAYRVWGYNKHLALSTNE